VFKTNKKATDASILTHASNISHWVFM